MLQRMRRNIIYYGKFDYSLVYVFTCVRMFMVFIRESLFIDFTKERLFMLVICVRLFMLFIEENLFIVFAKENCLTFSNLHVQCTKVK